MIARGVLRDDDFAPMIKDLSDLVDSKAREWMSRGLVSDDHPDAPFEARLARVAAQMSSAEAEKELCDFGLSLDTMHALTQGTFDFFFTQRLIRAVQSIVGP